MKEAVELCEAVEKSGKIYAYAENYCYMPATYEMKKLYKSGAVGEFEYGEGEYMHNCESIWHDITRVLPEHWRNNMHACYYCTHSIGPLIHITGLRPVKVSGFEVAYNDRMYRMGAKAAPIGLEIITLENGAVLKSVHGIGCAGHSIWYSINGSKGRMETAREDAENEDVQTLYVNCDENEGDNNSKPRIVPTWDHLSDFAEKTGHGGADYYFMHNVIEWLRGNKADVIDVYEGLDMFLPGMFAYFSALEGGIPMEIPDLRNPEEREKWRNDTRCTDPKVAGDMFIPGYSKGNPDIPEETYLKLQEKYREEMAKK
jgi:predicted dehydrogenase